MSIGISFAQKNYMAEVNMESITGIRADSDDYWSIAAKQTEEKEEYWTAENKNAEEADGLTVEGGLGETEALINRGQRLKDRLSGEKQAPYSYLADANGQIEYNGVIFQCDYRRNAICLGDMTQEENVINIPLSEGGCLKVNRDNLGDLAKAIDMFSPEDINRIMRAIALDTRIQQMKLKIDEDTNSIGEGGEAVVSDGQAAKDTVASMGNTETSSIWEAWIEAWAEAQDEENPKQADQYYKSFDYQDSEYITQVQEKLLVGKIDGQFEQVIGNSVESARAFAEEALEQLERKKELTQHQKEWETEYRFYQCLKERLAVL